MYSTVLSCLLTPTYPNGNDFKLSNFLFLMPLKRARSFAFCEWKMTGVGHKYVRTP